jgi:hypothetical protein
MIVRGVAPPACFLTTRMSQTHVGIYNTGTQSPTGDIRAAVMNVGVGGVALPQLRSVGVSYHASCFSPRLGG